MLQAQEMFSNSNKLTRPEKALILGFIAGSRGKFQQKNNKNNSVLTSKIWPKKTFNPNE